MWEHLRTFVVPGAISACLLATTIGATAGATTIPGSPGKDVTVGRDNDNAQNTFVQPLGVAAKQHMDNTDVLFGRDNDDLLIGKKGGDTLLGGRGSDILVGGPEKGVAPNSDVLIGEEGNDINVWAPGDGSDAFLGNEGFDTMIFAPFRTNPNGSLRIDRVAGRFIPRVKIDQAPQFSCQIVKVPASQRLGFQFLVRFKVNGVTAVTVRQKDVERVLCPSPLAGRVRVASLQVANPQFVTVPKAAVGGIAAAIVR